MKLTLEQAEKLPLVARMPIQHGVSFYQCVMEAISIPELVSNFDRLTGCNLGRKGTGLDLQIDEVTGRMNHDIEQFMEFCWKYIFTRFGDIQS